MINRSPMPKRATYFFLPESNVDSAASSTSTQEPERATTNVDPAHLVQETAHCSAGQPAGLPENNEALEKQLPADRPIFASAASWTPTHPPEQSTTNADTAQMVQETTNSSVALPPGLPRSSSDSESDDLAPFHCLREYFLESLKVLRRRL